MKDSIKNLLVVLTLVASFVAAQGVWAKEDLDCGTSVTGDVCKIDYALNTITVCDDCTVEDCGDIVYGIPLAYLAKWESLDLDGMSVEINAHECPLSGTLMACDLTTTVDDVTYEFRQGDLGKNGNAGE
ncbi:MAG: hypothetical protein KKD01_01420 [Proteobacteria bacterium]|nr:hypothetical protein [Pseudomonadota bacterium]MBU1417148.1 hypothetical protein [Pseudomonadota bacterium]MBU1453359.1 hypothetical protein [Pseudomonadota bacterium]